MSVDDNASKLKPLYFCTRSENGVYYIRFVINIIIIIIT